MPRVTMCFSDLLHISVTHLERNVVTNKTIKSMLL